MTFTNDLAIGRKAEKEFAKLLIDIEKVISLEFSQWKFPYRDIKIITPDWEKTYEVKSDTKAQDTGNFVIESRFKWSPSWIFTSKADYIVYYVKWEWWVAERWALILKLIDIEKEEVKGWDWRQSTMWKIKCTELPNLFSKIKTNGQGGEENA